MTSPVAEFTPRSASQTPTDKSAPQPCWVLLRGLVREARHWGDFPQRLADALQARVLCPDLPGNGQLYREKSPVRLADQVEYLRRTVHAFGNTLHSPSVPVQLLGLSMGGMVATEWALQYPREIGRLVLINSSLGDLNPPWQRLRPSALLPLTGALLLDTPRREALIYRLTCRHRVDNTLLQWVSYARDCPVSRANFLRQLYAAAFYRSGHRVPAVPALVLSSHIDAMVNPACSIAIAEHWHAQHAVHPSAGHDLPHDAPGWVLEQIARWQSSA